MPQLDAPDQTPLTAGCLFAGMGGFADGLARSGFQIAWASDINRAACDTFRHRFPDTRVIERDARELSLESDQLPPVDMLAAGFPCQSFSQAGRRLGFDDRRGEVFFEIPRLLSEWAPEQRPRLIALENVPHLLYGGDGWWFDTIRRELRAAGYWFRRESCWLVNVKDATDIPQDRERLFLVAANRAHFNYNPYVPPPPPPQSERTNSKRISLDDIVDRTQRAPEGEYLNPDNRYAKMIDAKIAEGDPRHIYQLRRSYVREKQDGLCPTLTANMGRGGHNVPFVEDQWGIRRLSVQEIARLQGFQFAGIEQIFPDQVSSPDRYRLLGNAVCPSLSYQVAQQTSQILRKAPKS